jgi:hypothetical protein
MPDISKIMIEKTRHARLNASIPGLFSNANLSPSAGIEATTCMDGGTSDTLASMNAKGVIAHWIYRPLGPINVLGYEMIVACNDKVWVVLNEVRIASQESSWNVAAK